MIIVAQNSLLTIETLELSIESQYNAMKNIYEYGIAFNANKKARNFTGVYFRII